MPRSYEGCQSHSLWCRQIQGCQWGLPSAHRVRKPELFGQYLCKTEGPFQFWGLIHLLGWWTTKNWHSVPSWCFQTTLTVVLPLPVAPMTLTVHNRFPSKWFWNRIVTNSRDSDIIRIDDERLSCVRLYQIFSDEWHRKDYFSGCRGWFSPWS